MYNHTYMYICTYVHVNVFGYGYLKVVGISNRQTVIEEASPMLSTQEEMVR